MASTTSTVPAETDDFRRFIADHPSLAAKAKEYDLKARESLKVNYGYFDQGLYGVINERTKADPLKAIEHGERMPTTSKAKGQASKDKQTAKSTAQSDDEEKQNERAKFFCGLCKAYRFDPKRHMEIHNQDPGQSIYCPVDSCHQRMVRNDQVTCVEHLVNKHSDWVFGHPRAVHEVKRYRILRLTTDEKYLKRLTQQAIAKLNEEDQTALRGYIAPRVHIDELATGLEVFDCSFLKNVIDKKALECGDHGLATDNEIHIMTKQTGIEYLVGLRKVLHQINPEWVETLADLEGVKDSSKTTPKTESKSKDTSKGVSKSGSKSKK